MTAVEVLSLTQSTHSTQSTGDAVTFSVVWVGKVANIKALKCVWKYKTPNWKWFVRQLCMQATTMHTTLCTMRKGCNRSGSQTTNLQGCTLLLIMSLYLDLLASLLASFLSLRCSRFSRSSFSCASRQRWKFSTTTPTNMLSTKNPTNKRNDIK